MYNGRSNTAIESVNDTSKEDTPTYFEQWRVRSEVKAKILEKPANLLRLRGSISADFCTCHLWKWGFYASTQKIRNQRFQNPKELITVTSFTFSPIAGCRSGRWFSTRRETAKRKNGEGAEAGNSGVENQPIDQEDASGRIGFQRVTYHFRSFFYRQYYP